MRDRLFSVIDNQPIVTAELINLRASKRLWEQDKTKDKSNYKKWLLYIYFMCDYRSPYFEETNKEKLILKNIFQDSTQRVPRLKLQDCIDTYISRNTPAEQRSLEAAINSAESITSDLRELQKEDKQFNMLIAALDKEIETLIKMGQAGAATEVMKDKLTLQEKRMNLTKNSSDLIPKIEKNVEVIINLREKVEKAVKKIETSSSKVENFMIDSLIAEKEVGKYTQ